MKLSVRLTSRDRDRLRGSTVFKQRANLLWRPQATAVTFPSSRFIGGAFPRLSTIIIAYFDICNNNFQLGKWRCNRRRGPRNGNANQAQRTSRDNPKKL